MAYRYEHNEIVRVIDGDTIEIRIDFGFKTTHGTNLRINGINTPEKTGKEKKAGKNVLEMAEYFFSYVDECIKDGTILLVTTSTGKPKFFGRSVGDMIFKWVVSGREISFADILLDNNIALPWDGKGKKPKFTAKDIKRIADLDPLSVSDRMFESLI